MRQTRRFSSRAALATTTLTLLASSALAVGCGDSPISTDDAATLPDGGEVLDAAVEVDAFVAHDAYSAADAPLTPDARHVAPDAFASVDATEPTMPTYSYVVSLIAAEPVTDGRTAGVNIDGRDSGSGGGPGSCEERRPDFVSSITALPGVDNQLSNSLLTTLTSMGVDINMNLERAIADGTFLLLITVDDVEDFVNDGDGVHVTLGLGETESGSAPLLLADGSIAPGQRFRRTMELSDGTATLAGNRVSVDVPRIPIPLVLGGAASTDLTDAQLTARISEGSLFDGEGGGGLSVESLVAFAAANGFGEVARAILPALADLDPSAADRASCSGISAGFRLEAVSATVVP